MMRETSAVERGAAAKVSLSNRGVDWPCLLLLLRQLRNCADADFSRRGIGGGGGGKGSAEFKVKS
jgi:hypothetical protein